MTARPTARARPVPSAETQPFWDGLAAHVVRLRRCAVCDRLLHPRHIRCPGCLGELCWNDVSGRASLATWTVVHRPFAPGFTPPYVVGQVCPVEETRIRLDATLDVPPGDLRLALPVVARFVDDDRGFSVPVFG